MTGKDKGFNFESYLSELQQLDSAIDAVGKGAATPHQDPLMDLFAQARAEVHADIPAAPNLAALLGNSYLPAEASQPQQPEVVALEQVRRRRFGRVVAAATAGGLSLTSVIVAGAAAATLAVGGIGFTVHTIQQNKVAERALEESSSRAAESASSESAASAAAAKSDAANTAERSSEQREPSEADVPEAQPTEASEPVMAGGVAAPESAATTASTVATTESAAERAQRLLANLNDPAITELPEYQELARVLEGQSTNSQTPSATTATVPAEPQPVGEVQPTDPPAAPAGGIELGVGVDVLNGLVAGQPLG